MDRSWVYHVTQKRNVASIMRKGLRPSTAAGHGRWLFFTDRPPIDPSDYGDVLLRFPRPAGTQRTPDGWSLGTRQVVPPDEIEISTGEDHDEENWVPLKDAPRFTSLSGVKTKTTQWAYHGTSPEALPSIRKHGLLPKRPSGYKPHKTNVFFTDDVALAEDYGDVILRFPWPDDVEPFSLEDESVTEYASPHPVLPQRIQVLTAKGWMKL
jgi:hypothetical protein